SRPCSRFHSRSLVAARQGMTLVPLSIFFNGRGRAKVELALAKGKKAPDKRAATKEREWKREQGRLLRDRG
uniref:SsrA-binding protein n=1 Tax=Erythrobacter donghaensis TaxID=267135 RepID=UPI0018C7B6EC